MVTERDLIRSLMHPRSLLAIPVLLLAILAALLVVWPAPVQAQAIQFSNSTVTSQDPTAITFTLRVTTPSGLSSARLEYQVRNPDGSVGGGGDAEVSPGSEVDLTFTLTTRDGRRYIPVGSRFTYHWVLEANDGSTLQTPDEEYLFLDGRYQWQPRTEGQVTVYSYGNNEVSATAALRAAQVALDETSELLETTVPYEVRIVVWRSEDEGRLAMRQQSATFDAQIRTGGQRVAPDILFVFDNAPDIVRHEMAHIVTHVAGDGPFVGLPSWLDEGTAVYMQGGPGGYEPAVRAAIQSNRTLSLRSMQTSPNRPEDVNVFYGQSWSIVTFLIDEYGRPQFAELFRTIREGARIDDALTTVYGFNQDGLYNAWREANGLEPVATAGPASGNAPSADGTRAPLGVPTAASGASSNDPVATLASGDEEAPAGTPREGDGGANSTAAFVVLGLTAVMAVALGGGGVYLLRQRRS